MLQSHNPPSAPVATGGQGPEVELDLEKLISAARRHARIILFCGFIGVVLAVGYALTTTPLYTASVHILIDNRQASTVSEYSATDDLPFESGAVDSQVEILRSEHIANAVIDDLELMTDPTFSDPPNSLPGYLIDTAKSVIGGTLEFGDRVLGIPGLATLIEDSPLSPEEEAYELRRSIMENLMENMQVTRIGLTYVLDFSFTATDAQKSAIVANAFANAYLTDQLDAKFEATERAANWLQDRITELREKSMVSDRAVQSFRAEHGLILSGGQLINEQQLAELNALLVEARADTAESRAKYQRVTNILASGDMNAAVAESLANPVVTNLRTQLTDAAAREAELSGTYGRDHIAAQRKRNEMTELRRLLFEELDRIAETYKSEMEIAETRLRSMEDNLDQLVGANVSDNQSLVSLRELEREAAAYEGLYETFLQRYQEAVHRQSFPITEARVITRAERPIEPSHPRKLLVLALGLMAGLTAGVGVAGLRELRDRVFRRADQIAPALGLECIGMFPLISGGSLSKRSARRQNRRHQMRVRASSIFLDHPAQPAAEAEAPTEFVEGGVREFTLRDSAMRHVLDAPLGQGAETMRAIKMSVDGALHDKETKIVGFVSTMPDEGKTTVAHNFAAQVASMGLSVLLLDGDLRNPGMTRILAPKAGEGLLEVLSGDRRVNGALLRESGSGITFLPTVTSSSLSFTGEVLGSRNMEKFLADMRKRFDMIVIDLPPLGPVIDVRAAERLIDCFVYIIEWGRTPIVTTKEVVSQNIDIWRKTTGVVLNKVDMRRLSSYAEYGAHAYLNSKYQKYYTYQ